MISSSDKKDRSTIVFGAIAIGLVGAIFYWLAFRPGQVRIGCQALVDRALASRLERNGFKLSLDGRWVRWDEQCVDDQGKGIFARMMAGETCARMERREVEPDPEDLERDRSAASELYGPCLRRHGLRE